MSEHDDGVRVLRYRRLVLEGGMSFAHSVQGAFLTYINGSQVEVSGRAQAVSRVPAASSHRSKTAEKDRLLALSEGSTNAPRPTIEPIEREGTSGFASDGASPASLRT